MIPYIKTPSFLVFTWVDGTPRQVPKTHPNFSAISELIEQSGNNYIIDIAEKLADLLEPARMLEKVAAKAGTELFIDKDSGSLVCKIEGKEVKIPASLATYILDLYKSKADLSPFVLFITKLMKNPDEEVAGQLWDFIAASGLCLTAEGNFMAYKNVNNDFTSAYDGKTPNTPGTTLCMPRHCVEKDPHKTCAHGLHFAAYGYLRHYAYGKKTVLVSVSPEHVVSIPSDYSFQKGRACQYTIVREVRQPEELKDLLLFSE